jgi:hypothetical protein
MPIADNGTGFENDWFVNESALPLFAQAIDKSCHAGQQGREAAGRHLCRLSRLRQAIPIRSHENAHRQAAAGLRRHRRLTIGDAAPQNVKTESAAIVSAPPVGIALSSLLTSKRGRKGETDKVDSGPDKGFCCKRGRESEDGLFAGRPLLYAAMPNGAWMNCR